AGQAAGDGRPGRVGAGGVAGQDRLARRQPGGGVSDPAPDVELVADAVAALAADQVRPGVGEGDGAAVAADGGGGGPGPVGRVGRRRRLPGGVAHQGVGAVGGPVGRVVVVEEDVGELVDVAEAVVEGGAVAGGAEVGGVVDVGDVLAVVAEARQGQAVD